MSKPKRTPKTHRNYTEAVQVGPDCMLQEKSLPLPLSGRLQWIPSVLRKTLFDFIKSCGSQIRLKFSEVALRGLLYSRNKKEMNFSTENGVFLMVGNALEAVPAAFSAKEIYH